MIISVVAAKIWYLRKCTVFIGPPCSYNTNNHYTLNNVTLSILTDHSSLATFLSLMVKAHVHSVTHGHLVSSENHTIRRRPTSDVNRTFTLNRVFRSFKVILIGVSRNSERGVVVIYNNVDLISETYEDTTTGKLQIRRFQPPRAGLTTTI